MPTPVPFIPYERKFFELGRGATLPGFTATYTWKDIAMERTVELIDVVERQLIVDERAGEDVEVVLEEIEVYDAVVLRPANLSE